MKILHIGPVKNDNLQSSSKDDGEIAKGIGPDGPSRSILGLIDGLKKIKVEVGLLSTKNFNHKSKSLPKKVTFLKPFTGKKYNIFTNPKHWIHQIESTFGIPDIVNFHDVYDFFSINISKEMKKRGWKYFVTPRGGLREFAQKRDRPKKIIANKLFFNSYLENAAFIHALTKEEANEISLFNPKLNKKIIAPNGVSNKVYNSIRNYKSDKKNRKIRIGFIGQLFTEIKGIDLFLEAISIYQNKMGDNLEFIFVGPIKSRFDQKVIDEKMKSIIFPDSVKFKGPLFGSDKWNELSNFDVFALTSRTEGMPVVVLEAMAFEKPCLVTKGTNMVDFIEEANAGWGTEASSKQISDKLKIISNSKSENLIQLGQNSRKYFLNNFTWDIVSKQYLKQIEKFI
tara:strand:+ start:961 stop:2151 length:1191 start_codon:yes stop_codon:yes gene_type:complete